ncbi:MAG: DUF5658 family protein [Nitrososphaerales archaeon]
MSKEKGRPPSKPSRLERYRRNSARDRKLVGRLDIEKLDNLLWPLYIGFICLNFLDIYTTSIALGSAQQIFQEHNLLAAKLFAMSTEGFLFALVIKFAPAFPLFYVVFLKDDAQKHSYQVRLVKVSALAALIVGDAFYIVVVLFNNIPVLLSGITNAN